MKKIRESMLNLIFIAVALNFVGLFAQIQGTLKCLFYLILIFTILGFMISESIILYKEKKYGISIENLETIKVNLSKEQWKEYQNTMKKLNPSEKQIYTRELLEIIEEKKELELEKFTDKTKSELSKWKI
ncbi:hypothetical protein [uncultured Fusobacterium sp.]|jgi:hypothetical protein|uniref:hypothetical protein n=1 Tax=uncultured Fusobacterium sp. TaxID=159267 RepID=UPI0015A627A8|nr:hypothetical protein [uncultured Fusobacterium sp.]